jgi:hypothetical protein
MANIHCQPIVIPLPCPSAPGPTPKRIHAPRRSHLHAALVGGDAAAGPPLRRRRGAAPPGKRPYSAVPRSRDALMSFE